MDTTIVDTRVETPATIWRITIALDCLEVGHAFICLPMCVSLRKIILFSENELFQGARKTGLCMHVACD